MKSPASKSSRPLPPASAANYAVNFFALALFFAGIFFVYARWPSWNVADAMGIGLLVTIVFLWIYDLRVLKVPWRPSTGLGARGKFDRRRLVIKLIGLNGTFLKKKGGSCATVSFLRKT